LFDLGVGYSFLTNFDETIWEGRTGYSSDYITSTLTQDYTSHTVGLRLRKGLFRHFNG